MKIGLCLSGGGARGLAHAGVLKALAEYQIFPKYVSGASAGSIIGAFYAAGLTSKEIIELASDTNLFKVFKLGMMTGGLTNHDYLRKILTKYLPEDDFKTLPVHLYVCVSNLTKGKWKIIHNGSIIDAVVASSSIPLIFEPIQIDGDWYVDGGLMNNFPIEPLVIECDLIIGVNVMPHEVRKDVQGFRNVAERSFDLIVWNNSEHRLSQCDIEIDIENVEEYGIFDFHKAEAIVEAGYQQTLAQIPQINQLISKLKS